MADAHAARTASPTLDGEAAARAVLAGTSTATPKTGDGLSEMIRQVKIARDIARKGRTSAVVALKTIVLNAPAKLRESLDGLPDKALAPTRPSSMAAPATG